MASDDDEEDITGRILCEAYPVLKKHKNDIFDAPPYGYDKEDVKQSVFRGHRAEERNEQHKHHAGKDRNEAPNLVSKMKALIVC